MDPTSSTSDGKEIAFLKWTSHRTIYMADINGKAIGGSRHFTIDETGNTPINWTPDGKYLVFWSVHDGKVNLIKQRENTDDEERIVSVKGDFADPVISTDGKWLLWLSGGAENSRRQVIRVSMTGGVQEPVDSVNPISELQCARFPSTVCILAERSDDASRVLVSEFNPSRGRGARITEFDQELSERLNMALSTDGKWLASMPSPSGPIRLISLRGRPERRIPTPGLNTKQFVRWSNSGKGLYVTNEVKGGSDLFYLDMKGNSKKLWHNDGDFAPIALESPNMHHLAIQGSTLEENLWLLENP